MAFGQQAVSELVPFVIPGVPDPQSLAAYPQSAAIGVDSPHVVARDAHFYLGDARIKFWGVVLTFRNCFPAHELAGAMAEHMAAAGINLVRLHLMDVPDWGQVSILDPHDLKRLSPDSLEKLDYLIDQFARHGIFVDVNLHVGRTYSKIIGLPSVQGLEFEKMIDLFTPQLVEGQEDYARQLLGHVSKYRHVRIADDPEVAIVEINNEDSFFMWNSRGSLTRMTPPYDGILREKFAAWLGEKYAGDEKLRAAWQRGATALGENLIAEPGVAAVSRNGGATWQLEQQPGQNVRLTRSGDQSAGRIEIGSADETVWHIQVEQRNLSVRARQYYSVRFKARADAPRKLSYQVSQQHEPWADLGLTATIDLTPTWKEFRAGFVATRSDDQTRLTFLAGASNVPFELKDVWLSTGGQEGLGDGESLEAKNIDLFGLEPSEARTADTYHFLAETEAKYWRHMYDLVKHEIGVKAMVTGTIVFGPLGLWEQRDMDFVDAHAYWEHPSFPGRPWDPQNWTIAQTAMVDHPAEATLFNLECSRLAGKPFTVSEYNHPAPADAQAECVPEIASFAAAQDWDMVLFHDYGDVPISDHFREFFDISENPAKWGFMAAGAAIFRGGAIEPLGRSITIPMSSAGDPIARLAKEQIAHDLNIAAAVEEVASINWRELLGRRVYLTLGSDSAVSNSGEDAGARMNWQERGGRGEYLATGKGALVWVGHANPEDANAMVHLKSPAFAAVVMTAMDGQPFEASRKILVAACGRCDNVGMQFSEDRHTVGRNWGNGPVRIEAVDAEVKLPAEMVGGKWTITKLAADGTPHGEAEEILGGRVKLDARDGTMWYLIERR
jgi:hypothetical protein